MKPKVLAAVIAAVLVVAAGAFALTRLNAPSEDAAIAFVPDEAVMYGNIFIRPSNDQKRALDALFRKVPGIDDTDEAIGKLTDLLDRGLATGGFDYEEDVEPWLGDQAAGFLLPGGTEEAPHVGFLVESKDDDALQDFVDDVAATGDATIEERTYRGETYLIDEEGDPFAVAIVDGFLIAGHEVALKDAIDAYAGGAALEDDEDFVDATEPLNDDWIGLFYFDLRGFVAAFEETLDLGPEERVFFDALGFGDQDPMAAIVYATRDSVTFESTGAFNPGGDFAQLTQVVAEPGLVPDLPADTWLAYGIPKLGRFLDGLFGLGAQVPGFDRSQIDAAFYGQTGLRLQEDVLSWMDDAGLFVQGTTIQEVGGGIVIESSDPAKTARLLERAEEALVQQGIRPTAESQGGLEGFSVQIPGAPAPIYALAGDRLVVAYGDAGVDAAVAAETLRDTDAFAAAQDAVGDDFNISFYVDVDAAQKLGEGLAAFGGVPLGATYEEDVKPWIDALTHVVAAAKMEGDTLVQKIVIGAE